MLKMSQRSISRAEVIRILLEADCIESYPTDKPFPSGLFASKIGGRLIHVVASFNFALNWVHIITAYIPDSDHFEADLRKREKS